MDFVTIPFGKIFLNLHLRVHHSSWMRVMKSFKTYLSIILSHRWTFSKKSKSRTSGIRIKQRLTNRFCIHHVKIFIFMEIFSRGYKLCLIFSGIRSWIFFSFSQLTVISYIKIQKKGLIYENGVSIPKKKKYSKNYMTVAFIAGKKIQHPKKILFVFPLK